MAVTHVDAGGGQQPRLVMVGHADGDVAGPLPSTSAWAAAESQQTAIPKYAPVAPKAGKNDALEGRLANQCTQGVVTLFLSARET